MSIGSTTRSGTTRSGTTRSGTTRSGTSTSGVGLAPGRREPSRGDPGRRSTGGAGRRTTAGSGSPRRPAGRAPAAPQRRTTAASKADTRRAGRQLRQGSQQRSRRGPAGDGAGRSSPFVVLVMVLLGGGLIATLWLTTASVSASYRLEQVQERNRGLSEHTEQLQREVAGADSTPQLAQRASELGLVPSGDPVRLQRRPDGSVQVYGTPQPAQPPPPADPPAGSPSDPSAGQPAPPAPEPAQQ